MKLAFIGTGKIIGDALFAAAPVESIEITAIFARPHSRGKAEAFAGEYKIPEIYTDYEELLEKTEADTVYIGLVNKAHYPYAKEALLHGKNVILEKPFTGFYEEAKELQKIAEEKKLFLFEAITVLHNEVFDEMKKNLGKLGTLRIWKAISLIPLIRSITAELCMISMSTTCIIASDCSASRRMWSIIRISGQTAWIRPAR